MTTYLGALRALSPAIPVTFARVAREQTSNSGRVDIIWAFSAGLVGAGSLRWPVSGPAPGERYRACRARTRAFFPLLLRATVKGVTA